MAANYTIVPVWQIRDKSYRTITEDSKPKTFTSESEAQKYLNVLQGAFDAGVESVAKVTKVTE